MTRVATIARPSSAQRALLEAAYQHAQQQHLPGALRAFRAVPRGTLGFPATIFEDVTWDQEGQPPPIYDREGQLITLPGPFKLAKIVTHRRTRLVELIMHQGTRAPHKLAVAYAWQGDHAFHLLSELVLLDDAFLVLREDLRRDEHLYMKAWRAQRQDDWFLDVDMDV
jgi:hypothetical protein